MSNPRERIFKRIQKALEITAPVPFPAFAEPPPSCYRDIPQSPEELLERFAEEFKAVGGVFHHARRMAEARALLQQLFSEAPGRSIAAADTTGLRELLAGLAGESLTWVSSRQNAGPALKFVDIGVTEADALVAQTGSIFLSTATGAGRCLSVLPPHHIVVASADQLVPTLGDALRLIRERYDGQPLSYFTLITGPSRTSDIEKVLVLGAHGPRRLSLVLVG